MTDEARTMAVQQIRSSLEFRLMQCLKLDRNNLPPWSISEMVNLCFCLWGQTNLMADIASENPPNELSGPSKDFVAPTRMIEFSGGPQMPTAPKPSHVVMTVECTHCKTKQKVHVAAKPGFALMGDQEITCVNCVKSFDVTVPDKIVGGPFPA